MPSGLGHTSFTKFAEKAKLGCGRRVGVGVTQKVPLLALLEPLLLTLVQRVRFLMKADGPVLVLTGR